MRFGAFRETRALRPPQIVHLEKLDLRRPPPQSLGNECLRIMIFGSRSWGSRSSDRDLTDRRFADKITPACARNVHSSGNVVSRAYTSPLTAASTGAALTSDAVQVAGLDRIYFGKLLHLLGGSRLDAGATPGTQALLCSNDLSFAFYSL